MEIYDRQCLLAFLKRGNGTRYYTGQIDGINGCLTQKAIRDFQQDFGGLNLTGEADGATDTALQFAVTHGIPAQQKSAGNWWDEIEFFTPEEFKCKCHGKYCNGYPHEIQPLLVQICDRARRWSGHPIQVISGLRCETHNRNENGVWNSQHMFGEAADLYFYGVSPDAALAWLQSQSDVRYAYRIGGCSNIHFDIHPVGR